MLKVIEGPYWNVQVHLRLKINLSFMGMFTTSLWGYKKFFTTFEIPNLLLYWFVEIRKSDTLRHRQHYVCGGGGL